MPATSACAPRATGRYGISLGEGGEGPRGSRVGASAKGEDPQATAGTVTNVGEMHLPGKVSRTTSDGVTIRDVVFRRVKNASYITDQP